MEIQDQRQAENSATQDRLRWAPLLANGAALISMSSIVGGAEHQDAALAALYIPISVFGSGMGLGLAAVQVALAGSRKLHAMGQLTDELAENSRLYSHLVGTSEPRHLDEHERVTVRRALDRAIELLGNVRTAMSNTWRLQEVSRALNAGSSIALGAGLAVLIIGHATGHLRLEPPPPTVNLRAQPVL